MSCCSDFSFPRSRGKMPEGHVGAHSVGRASPMPGGARSQSGNAIPPLLRSDPLPVEWGVRIAMVVS